jgi:hypothetical protein
MTNLVDLLNMCPDHHHDIAVLHGNLENLLVAGSSTLLAHREEEVGVSLGPEAHGGRGAQRHSRNHGPEFFLSVVVILQLPNVSKSSSMEGSKAWKGVTHIDFVILHVPKSQQLIEVATAFHKRMRANPALVQGTNKGVGLLNSGFLCPDQAVEGTENHVVGIGKALGLDRHAELVLGTLVLSVRRA